ncbi:acyl-CoA carboxylase subunit epsilon [Winogradskya consettensis]|uniref:acyl-CoA carboxylase subunit epsilon n=1 Tax=Winogradskya consettensis TaxID=113560 RepID=UPI001BB376B3|nr:acyl-CoA carboxylase subunit epsilon [Actinoplanes consettensis]
MDEEPLVNVVHGDPTPAELAALVIALTSTTPPTHPHSPSLWTRRARPTPRSDSWRESGLPL